MKMPIINYFTRYQCKKELVKKTTDLQYHAREVKELEQQLNKGLQQFQEWTTTQINNAFSSLNAELKADHQEIERFIETFLQLANLYQYTIEKGFQYVESHLPLLHLKFKIRIINEKIQIIRQECQLIQQSLNLNEKLVNRANQRKAYLKKMPMFTQMNAHEPEEIQKYLSGLIQDLKETDGLKSQIYQRSLYHLKNRFENDQQSRKITKELRQYQNELNQQKVSLYQDLKDLHPQSEQLRQTLSSIKNDYFEAWQQYNAFFQREFYSNDFWNEIQSQWNGLLDEQKKWWNYLDQAKHMEDGGLLSGLLGLFSSAASKQGSPLFVQEAIAFIANQNLMKKISQDVNFKNPSPREMVYLCTVILDQLSLKFETLKHKKQNLRYFKQILKTIHPNSINSAIHPKKLFRDPLFMVKIPFLEFPHALPKNQSTT